MQESKRSQIDVAACWAPWLRWVLQGWQSRQLAIALDATSLGDHFAAFNVDGIAIAAAPLPVALADEFCERKAKGSWEPEWKALLEHFRGVVPSDWTVIVLADRGLYAKWLFHAITALGWHPLLRINTNGRFRPEGWHHWALLSSLVPQVGKRWQGRGVAFKNAPGRLPCTLLGCWDVGHSDPWLVVTDLPPEAANVCWYGMRAWIENGFKRLKSAGWQWQYTRMDDPSRADRLWLALAVATWWLLSVGGQAETNVRAETMTETPLTQKCRRWRLVGIFRLGWNRIMACLLHHNPIPHACGAPEPWPKPLEPPEQPAPEPEQTRSLRNSKNPSPRKVQGKASETAYSFWPKPGGTSPTK